MDIFWIQWLYKNNLDELDQDLKKLEEKIGKDSLKLVFAELKNEDNRTEAIIKKMQSLKGEFVAFNKLSSDGYTGLKKMRQVGDWENDNTIISVKSILDLDLNYKLIEDTIRGMIFVKENEILRKYNHIDLRDGKKIDDQFRTKIITYLQNSLCSTIYFINNELTQVGNNGYVEVKISKFFVHNKVPSGYMEVCISGYSNYCNSSKKVIKIDFKENRVGKEEQKHQLTIQLESKDGKNNTFSVHFDTQVYEEGQQLDLDYLSKRISEHLKHFDISVNKTNQKQFVGWINISIHSMHECYALQNKRKIENTIKGIKNDKQYKVVFCLTPQTGFDLKSAIPFET